MAIATTADLIDFLQLEDGLSAPQERTAELLLDLATADVKAYARVNVEQVTDDVVTIPGTWSRRLVLPNWPVTAVASVVLDGVTLAATEYTVQRIGYLWRPRTWSEGHAGFSDVAGVGYWGGPDREVVVTYTHGYAEIPGDFKLACLEHAGWRMLNPASEVTRVQFADVVEQYALGEARGFTATSWRRPVRRYRRAAAARARAA